MTDMPSDKTFAFDSVECALTVPIKLSERVFPSRPAGTGAHIPADIVPIFETFGKAVDILILELAALHGGSFRVREGGVETVFDADAHLDACYARLAPEERAVFGNAADYRAAMHGIAAFYSGAELLCLTPVSAPGKRADARDAVGLLSKPLGLGHRNVLRAYTLSLVLAVAGIEARTAAGEVMERGIAPAWRTRSDFCITAQMIDDAFASAVPGWSPEMSAKDVAKVSKDLAYLHTLRLDPGRKHGLIRGQAALNDLFGCTTVGRLTPEIERRQKAMFRGIQVALTGSLAHLHALVASSTSAVATSEMAIAVVTAADAKVKSWYELSANAIRAFSQIDDVLIARCAKLKISREQLEDIVARCGALGFDLTDLGQRGCQAVFSGITADGDVQDPAHWTFQMRVRGKPESRTWTHPALESIRRLLHAEPELAILLRRIAATGAVSEQIDDDDDSPTQQSLLDIYRSWHQASRNAHGVPLSRRQEHDIQVSPLNDGIHDVELAIIPELKDTTTHNKAMAVLRIHLGLLGKSYRLDFRMGRNYALKPLGDIPPGKDGAVTIPVRASKSWVVGFTQNRRKQARGGNWTTAYLSTFALTYSKRRDGHPALVLRAAFTQGANDSGLLPELVHPSGDPIAQVAEAVHALAATLSVRPERAADREAALATINRLLADGMAIRVCGVNRGLARDAGYAVGELTYDPKADGPIKGSYRELASGFCSERLASVPTSAPALGFAIRSAAALLGRLKQAVTRGIGCILTKEVADALAQELGAAVVPSPTRPWLPRATDFAIAGLPHFDAVAAARQLHRYISTLPANTDKLQQLSKDLHRGAQGPLTLWHAPISATLQHLNHLLADRARIKQEWSRIASLSPADQLQWAEHLRQGDALANSYAYLGEPPIAFGQFRSGPRAEESRIWQDRIASLRLDALRKCASRVMAIAKEHRCHAVAIDSLDTKTSSERGAEENALWTRISPILSTEVFLRAAKKAGLLLTGFRGAARMGRDVGVISIPSAYLTQIAIDRSPEGTRRTIALRRGRQVHLPISTWGGDPQPHKFKPLDADISAARVVLDRAFGAGLHRSWIWTQIASDDTNQVLIPISQDEPAFLRFIEAHGLARGIPDINHVAFRRHGHFYQLIERPAGLTPTKTKRGGRTPKNTQPENKTPTKIRLAIHGLPHHNRWTSSLDEAAWSLPATDR